MSRLRRIELQDRLFFITTNLAQGVPPLSGSERDLVLRVLGEVRAANRFLLLGYVVMPDHAHVVLAVMTEAASVSSIVHQWKFKTGYAIQKARGKSGPFWQPRYFDFICRRARDVSNKLQYVHENPVEAHLVRRPQEWPWSSASFYSHTGTPLVIPDAMDFSGDPDELLWPAPWHRP